MSVNPIIFDTDPGIDDTIALLYAKLMGCKTLAWVTVFGNASIDDVTTNAFMLRAFLRQPEIPIYKGSVKPLFKDGIQAECHGTTGIGDFSYPIPPADCIAGSAIEFYTKLLQSNESARILCLGPLTNIAESIQANGMMADNLKTKLIFLGGVFGAPGNVSPVAEFNVYNDPDAFEIVLSSGCLPVIIPAEVCRLVTVSRSEIGAAVPASLKDSVHKLVDGFIDYYTNDLSYGGFAGGVLYDLLVIMYACHPELFEGEYCCVSVDTSNGSNRGKTDIIQSTPNAFVIRSVNASAVKQRLFNALSQAGF